VPLASENAVELVLCGDMSVDGYCLVERVAISLICVGNAAQEPNSETESQLPEGNADPAARLVMFTATGIDFLELVL
jgi:hypothetical protein